MKWKTFAAALSRRHASRAGVSLWCHGFRCAYFHDILCKTFVWLYARFEDDTRQDISPDNDIIILQCIRVMFNPALTLIPLLLFLGVDILGKHDDYRIIVNNHTPPPPLPIVPRWLYPVPAIHIRLTIYLERCLAAYRILMFTNPPVRLICYQISSSGASVLFRSNMYFCSLLPFSSPRNSLWCCFSDRGIISKP